MRFLDFLFEKDEVEDVKEEVVQQKVEEPAFSKPIITQEVVNKPMIKEEPTSATVNKSKHITIDEIEPKVVKQKAVEAVKQPYIFNPPISPIFGMVKNKEEKPRVLVNHKQKENTSRLGTVLSPYYGRGFVDETLVSVKEEISEEVMNNPLSNEPEELIFNNELPNEFENVVELEEYAEFDGLSIDDIIQHSDEINDVENGKNVIMSENISLFDGDIE